MPSPIDISNIPAPRVDFIDPRTGLMAREWYRFFFNLFNLTGSGTNDTSLTDLQIGPPPINSVLGEINTGFDQAQLAVMSDQAEAVLGQLGIVYDQAQLASMIAQYEQATLDLQNQFDTLPSRPELGTIASYNLNGSPTAGGVGYGTGSAIAFTPAGTSGQFLTSAAAGVPTWSSPSSVAVTSFSAGTTGLTPATATTGAITLAGTLAATSGGTGQSSYAVGDLLYASTTTALSKLADVATGNALISGGVGVAPAWGKIGLTTHVSGTLPVANGGTGTATAFTPGSVVFAGASGVYSQDNAQLFWDDTNNELGIGTATPSTKLDVKNTTTGSAIRATVTDGAGATDFGYGFYIDNTAHEIAAVNAVYTTSAGGGSGALTFKYRNAGTLTEGMRLNQLGSVGIGTATPDAQLTVNTIASFGDGATATPSIAHKGDLNTGFWFPAADTLAASTAGIERVRIAPSGHLGVNTIPSPWVASVRAIQLGSGASMACWDGGNGNVTLGANLYDSGGAVIRYINSAAAGAFNIISGAFTWDTAAAGVAGAAITFTRVMTLTAAGNVGIGTATPSNLLSVQGSANFTGNVTLGDATTDTVTVSGYMSVGGTPTASQGLRVIPSALTGTTQFGSVLSLSATSAATVGVEAARVQAATAAAVFVTGYAAGLWVRDAILGAGSTITNNYGVYVDDKAVGTNNYGLVSAVSSGTNKWNIYASGTANNYFAGNVGIGTATNLSTLTVNGSFASKSPSTVNAATYSVAATDGSLRFTTTNCTVTLPAASSFPGRILYLNTITANSVVSASSNVIPLGSNTAGTAILAATLGKFAMLQSDGTNWITMMAN